MLDFEQINELADDNLEKIFDALKIDYSGCHLGFEEIRMPCPVHGGDNPSAFSYNRKKKRWACYTRKCHEKNSTIIGLVSCVLNLRFEEAAKWVFSILGYGETPTIKDIETFKSLREAKTLIRFKERMESTAEKMPPIPIESFITEKDFYFRSKGFTEETINKFKIGFCSKVYKPMAMRSFAPIIEEDGKLVVGVTGRIIYEKCHLCMSYHDSNKGCQSDGNKECFQSKWKHYGLNTEHILYNFNLAKDKINNGVLVITEGPKDVWWLDQNGVENSVCLLGTNLSDSQIKSIIRLGVLRVIFCLDNDKAVHSIKAKMLEKLGRYFKVTDASCLMDLGKDIADMTPEFIRSIILPLAKS